MRKMIMAGLLGFSSIALFAAEAVPLKVKTGQWEGTTTIVTTGTIGVPPEVLAQMSPEQRAKVEAMMQKNEAGGARSHSYTSKSCVTEKDLSTDPFKQKIDPTMKCVEHVIRSNGSDFEVDETCTGQESVKSQVHMTLHAVDSEHVTGKGEVTAEMGGHTMHSQMDIKAKWLGACPAGEKKE